MVLVDVFCFWFSVRLGSIIIGVVTALQCCGLLTIYGLWTANPEEYTNKLNLFLEKLLLNEEATQQFASTVVEVSVSDLQVYLSPVAFFISALLFSSLLLIFASFKCKPLFIYPFVIIYPLYVFFLLALHTSLMISFKNQNFGIGDIIFYSNVGGFIILFLLYTWVCVLSFLQILKELYQQLMETKKVNKCNISTVSMNPAEKPFPYYRSYKP